LLRTEFGQVVLGAAAAGITGYLAGAQLTTPADAANSSAPLGRVGTYTFADSGCDDGEEVDPINVVFVLDGRQDWIRDHAFARSHGGYPNHAGSEQYFREGNAQEGQILCRRHNDQSASSCDACDRYHFRVGTSRTAGGVDHHYAKYGIVSMADAHFEYFLFGCASIVPPLPGKHSVAGDDESFPFYDINGGLYYVEGGFNRGKEDILKNWVIASGHDLLTVRDWDNEMPKEQCDPIGGDPMTASSDGFVYYIGTKEYH
jgi:hypothetical protein